MRTRMQKAATGKEKSKSLESFTHLLKSKWLAKYPSSPHPHEIIHIKIILSITYPFHSAVCIIPSSLCCNGRCYLDREGMRRFGLNTVAHTLWSQFDLDRTQPTKELDVEWTHRKKSLELGVVTRRRYVRRNSKRIT